LTGFSGSWKVKKIKGRGEKKRGRYGRPAVIKRKCPRREGAWKRRSCKIIEQQQKKKKL